MNNEFNLDLIKLETLIQNAIILTKELLDKHENGDPADRFILYYTDDNLRIIKSRLHFPKQKVNTKNEMPTN